MDTSAPHGNRSNDTFILNQGSHAGVLSSGDSHTQDFILTGAHNFTLPASSQQQAISLLGWDPWGPDLTTQQYGRPTRSITSPCTTFTQELTHPFPRLQTKLLSSLEPPFLSCSIQQGPSQRNCNTPNI